MTPRMELWIHCVEQRVGDVTVLEERLIEAAAKILQQASAIEQDEEYEVKCIATISAIIEITRSVANGESFEVVKA